VLCEEEWSLERAEFVADWLRLVTERLQHGRHQFHIGESLDHLLRGVLIDSAAGHLCDAIAHERLASLAPELSHRRQDAGPFGGALALGRMGQRGVTHRKPEHPVTAHPGDKDCEHHFKEINDSFGHAAGDDLLKQVGPRLTGSLRSSDLLVRLGGDELGVLLMDTDPTYAATVARRLLASLEEPFVLGAVSVRISASIGIAIAPTDATDTAGLLRCADLAMYRAKAKKSSVEIYQQDLNVGGNRLLLVEELRAAVEANQFVLHYQPKIDLHTGETSSVEALIRWPHPKLGMVPPLDFLPLAEEVGLMGPLTALVLDEALAQCATWRKASPNLTVSVNVSATNLLDGGFIGLVGARLTRHGLPPGALILEITETTVLREFERCRRVIAQLRDLGLAVSIDDFGAGFTSLAYLGSLAVSEIKLDRVFIAGLAAAERGRELVGATIDLGHALGLRVVAEGIEDRATLDLLTSLGCDIGQGYFISRPRPAEDTDFGLRLAS